MKKYCGILALLALSACDPSMDMQGNDPREYYAEHPIKNTVETRTQTIDLHFASGEPRLSPAQTDRLSDALHGISMLAVQSIQVSFASTDENSEARKTHLAKMLRNMGYGKGEYAYKPSAKLKAGDVQLVVTYDVVVSPDCPDWRTSPVSTHSNTKQGNFGCSSEVNLGRMIADPHDLVRGTEGDISISAAKADIEIGTKKQNKIRTKNFIIIL